MFQTILVFSQSLLGEVCKVVFRIQIFYSAVDRLKKR